MNPGVSAHYRSHAIRKADLQDRPDSILFKESRILDIVGDRGELRTDVLSLDTIGLSIGRVHSTGHRVWLRDEASFIMLAPMAGRLELEISNTRYRANNSRLTAFRPTERLTTALPDVFGSFHAVTIQISAEKVKALLASRDVDLAKAFKSDGTEMASPGARYLIQLLPHLVDGFFLLDPMTIPARVIAEMGNLVEELLVQIVDETNTRARPRRALSAFHRVRMAEEILRARSDETVSLLDIAQELGVSLRSLQLGFKEIYGTSPRSVLERLRMENARSRLLKAGDDDRVTTIAMDCGFFHLSRFTQAYARRYGERPSETLARQRRQRPGAAILGQRSGGGSC